MKLHLYILASSGPIDRDGAKRAAASVNTVPIQATMIKAGQLYLVTAHYASWFGFLYDNEVYDKDLARALPILMNHEDTDAFVFYKKTRDNKFFMQPRIFRSHVVLKEDSLYPRGVNVKYQHILDGWIHEL